MIKQVEIFVSDDKGQQVTRALDFYIQGDNSLHAADEIPYGQYGATVQVIITPLTSPTPVATVQKTVHQLKTGLTRP